MKKLQNLEMKFSDWEAVDLAVADDPLARQSAIEAISNSDKPRSTAGRGGTRAYRGKSKPKLN